MQATVSSLLEKLNQVDWSKYAETPSWKTLLIGMAGTVGAAALWEQISLMRRTKGMPGPSWSIPFVGSMGEIIMNPHDFYERQRTYGDLAWSSALGQLIIFTKNSDITRSIFAQPENYTLWLTMGAKKILGENNIAFMTGDPHKQIRKKLLPLFTPRALSIFLKVQEKCIRKNLEEWCKTNGGGADFSKEFETRPLVRDMNVETSLSVFVGPYMDDALRAKISGLFWTMNAGFLSVPFDIPGTSLYKAIKAREALVEIFIGSLHQSRARMAQGEEALCLLDVLVEEEIKVGKPIDTDKEIGFHIMDFLFASQDASTSSIVWVIALLANHPEVRAKVLEEQIRLRPMGNGDEVPISSELVNRMTYTKQVIKEVLRYRPPATMVPHIAVKDTQIQGHDFKKGTVFLPSIWAAHIEDYVESDKFDPERFHPDREQRDPATQKSFLTFGYGPHRCIGMQYALNHLVLFASELVRFYDYKRTQTPGGDDIIYLPTIFPKDGAIISIKRRPVA